MLKTVLVSIVFLCLVLCIQDADAYSGTQVMNRLSSYSKQIANLTTEITCLKSSMDVNFEQLGALISNWSLTFIKELNKKQDRP